MNVRGPAARAAHTAANAQRLSQRLGTKGIGGFTFDPRTGNDVVEGYSTADFGSEREHPGTASPEQISRYSADVDDRIASDPLTKVGGWHPRNADPENETAETSFLDVSKVYPADHNVNPQGGHRQANSRAVLNAQDGYYDLGGKKYHPTEYPKWTDQQEQRTLAQAMHDAGTWKPPSSLSKLLD